jgi:N-acetylmuramoyl-L-alanine amidase
VAARGGGVAGANAARPRAAEPPIVDSDWSGVQKVVPANSCSAVKDASGAYRERNPQGVVIHVLQAEYAGVIANWSAGTSCLAPHYVVRKDGEITQLVAERYMAQHASAVNTTHIGIEHDGWDGDPANFTEAMYLASAALVRDICARNAISVDRANIIGHDELPIDDHGDPAGYWDWDYYLALVRWDGTTAATKPLREVVDATGPAATSASAAWKSADRDSGVAAWKARRERGGPYPENAYGARYLWADGGPDAPADDAIEFMFIAPEAGAWELSGWWPILSDANPATRIEIRASREGEPLFTQVVDQRARSVWRIRRTVALPQTPTWHVLPAVDLEANDPVFVRVFRRSDEPGKVIADAFRFLRRP